MSKKVGFTIGPELKELEGHTLVIIKTLYRFRSSRTRFHKILSITLRKEKFIPTKRDLDL